MTAKEARYKTKVMAIDPGKTVGFVIGVGEVTRVAGQWRGETFPAKLWYMIHSNKVEAVVIEQFDIRSFTNETLETVKLIGAIEFVCEMKTIPYRYVTPSSKKKFERDPRVKELKKNPGPHAADAEMIRLWDLAYGQW